MSVILFSAILCVLKIFPAGYDVYLVYTTDKNYVFYTKTSIKSAIVNKKPSSRYHINILCVDLTKEEEAGFKALEENNVSINIVPLTVKAVSKIKHKTNHTMYVTRADLFKFFMPDFFPDIDKILYLDSDTIVRRDLSELFNTDIKDYYLAAAKRPGRNYNCGVMLYNLKKWREDNIQAKMLEAKQNSTERNCMSQCVFNQVLPSKGQDIKTKTFSTVYNVIIYWFSDNRWKEEMQHEFNINTFEDFKKACAPYLDKINNLDDLEKQAVIIHHAGGRKPWCRKYKEYEKFTDEWVKYAEMINPKWTYENCKYKDPGLYREE